MVLPRDASTLERSLPSLLPSLFLGSSLCVPRCPAISAQFSPLFRTTALKRLDFLPQRWLRGCERVIRDARLTGSRSLLFSLFLSLSLSLGPWSLRGLLVSGLVVARTACIFPTAALLCSVGWKSFSSSTSNDGYKQRTWQTLFFQTFAKACESYCYSCYWTWKF